MGAYLKALMQRASSGSHVPPTRPDFKLYWEVANGVGTQVANFPGILYYPGLTPGGTVGLHSRTVQATVQADMEGAIWNTRTVTAGNGGISGTSLTVTAFGTKIELGCRITGTGIPADTTVVSYSGGGSDTGTMVISQAAAVANGTTVLIWRLAGTNNIVGGNGGVSGDSLTITSNPNGAVGIKVGGAITGYGIPSGTTTVSYTGTTTGTLVMSQAAAVPNNTILHSSYAPQIQLYFADYEGGGESGSDMQNCLTWMRGATGWGGSFPSGFPAKPIGIYGGNQCALNAPSYQPSYWNPSSMSASSATNDGMISAVTGTGNATCSAAMPEVYCQGRADQSVNLLRWVSSEFVRMGIGSSTKLIPMLNPDYPPGWTYNVGSPVYGKHWRALLEAAIRDPNIYGLYIWHGDRGRAWDDTEGWFVETLDFINTYGITNGNPF